MKSMKKIGAIFLAFVLAFSLCAAAFAADDVIGNTDDTGTVTVTGIQDEAAESNLTVTVYPIFLAYYDANGNFAGYASLYPDIVKDLDAIKQSDGTYAFSEEQLKEIGNALSAADVSTDGKGAETILAAAEAALPTGCTFGKEAEASYTLTRSETSTADEGYSYSGSVAIGSYYVKVSHSEAVEYGEAVVSTWYTTDDGKNIIENGTVNMITDGKTWLKAETPEVDKSITGVNDTQPSTGNSNGTSANIGDTINYQVKVSDVPYMGGLWPYMTVTDTLSEGLTADLSWDQENNKWEGVSVTIEGNTLAQGTYYVVSVVLANGTVITDGDTNFDTTLINADSLSGARIIVNFVVHDDIYDSSCPFADETGFCNGYHLNDYEGKTMYIYYNAILNENALLDQDPNDNDVVLDYTTDSTDEHGEHNLPEDETHTYTFDIDGYLGGQEGSVSTDWNGSITNGIITKTGEDTITVPGEGGNEGYTYSAPLGGATFGLYTDYTCENPYTNGTAVDPNDGTHYGYFDGTVTSDVNGKLTITGLAEGTYYLKETVPPDGYALNNTVYKIVIAATYNEDGTLATWTVTVSAKLNPENADDFPEGNSSSFTVPHTLDDPDTSIYGPFVDNNDGTLTAPAGLIDNDANITLTLTDTNITYDADGNEVTVNVYEYVEITEDHQNNSVTSTAYTVTQTIVKDSATGTTSTSYEYTKASITSGVDTEIANTTTPTLPNTGGIGTTLFYIIGALIIVAAIVLFVTMRRRNNRRTAE